jgi:hypothetical protein
MESSSSCFSVGGGGSALDCVWGGGGGGCATLGDATVGEGAAIGGTAAAGDGVATKDSELGGAMKSLLRFLFLPVLFSLLRMLLLLLPLLLLARCDGSGAAAAGVAAGVAEVEGFDALAFGLWCFFFFFEEDVSPPFLLSDDLVLVFFELSVVDCVPFVSVSGGVARSGDFVGSSSGSTPKNPLRSAAAVLALEAPHPMMTKGKMLL